jgi:UDP-glucose 4-epimerase
LVEALHMARVLLLGGGGFIGFHLAERLHAGGHEVAVVDSFQSYVYPLKWPSSRFLEERHARLLKVAIVARGDVSDCGVLLEVIADFAPSHIVHLAGVPLISHANRHVEEAYASMVGTTISALRAAKSAKDLRKFTFVSSSTIYGDFQYQPVGEDHPAVPKEVYAGSKLASEILVQSFARRFGLRYAIVRPSAVYGPFDVNRRVVQVFVENALLGHPLRVDDPSARLDFTHVTDTARGIALATLSDNGDSDIFNVTRGHGRSLAELVEVIRKHVPNVVVECGNGNPDRPKRGTLSIEVAKRQLGYEPAFSLEAGVAEYVPIVKAALETRPR